MSEETEMLEKSQVHKIALDMVDRLRNERDSLRNKLAAMTSSYEQADADLKKESKLRHEAEQQRDYLSRRHLSRRMRKEFLEHCRELNLRGESIAKLQSELKILLERIAEVEGERDRQCEFNAGQIAKIAQLEAQVKRAQQNTSSFQALRISEAETFKKRVAEYESEKQEHEQLFGLRRNADMRAIKRWQEATGRTMVCPDHTDLCVWLLERLGVLESALRRNRQGYLNILEMRKLTSEKWGMGDGYGGRYGALTREEIDGVIAGIDAALNSAIQTAQPEGASGAD